MRLSVVSSQGDGSLTTGNQQLTTTPAFTFTPRGSACPGLRAGVQAKGKGEMYMYFVHVGN